MFFVFFVLFFLCLFWLFKLACNTFVYNNFGEIIVAFNCPGGVFQTQNINFFNGNKTKRAADFNADGA